LRDTLETQTRLGKTEKKVCIVVVNYNGKNFLRNLLDSLIRKTGYQNYQVVLVDNGSTDGSVKFVEKTYPRVRLIRNFENLGYSIANNQGIRACDADYYLLLNTDMKIHTKDYLTNLVNLSESDRSIGIVTCCQPSSKEDLAKSLKKCRDPPAEVDFAPGSLMLVRKETIDDIGALEEEFTPAYFEDTDLCCRALSAGWKIVYDPSTIVFHFGEGTAKKVFAKIPQYFHVFVRNRLMFDVMNHSLTDLPRDLYSELRWLGSALFVGTGSERKEKLCSLGKAYNEAFSRMHRLIYKRRKRKLLKRRGSARFTRKTGHYAL